jgi:hypothetical protein
MEGIEERSEIAMDQVIHEENQENVSTPIEQVSKEKKEDLGAPHVLIYGIPFDVYDGAAQLLPFPTPKSTTSIFDDEKIKAYDKLHRQKVQQYNKFVCEGDSLYAFATSFKSNSEFFNPNESDTTVAQAAAFVAPCIENELEKLDLESHLFQMREVYATETLSLPTKVEELRDLMDTLVLQELDAVNSLEQAIQMICKYGAFFVEKITLGGVIITTAKMEKRQWTASEMMTSRLAQVQFDNSSEPMTKISRASFEVKDETCEWGCTYVNAHVTRQAHVGQGRDDTSEEKVMDASLASMTWLQKEKWQTSLGSCNDPQIVSWTMRSMASLALNDISHRFLLEAIIYLLNYQMQKLKQRDEFLHEASTRAAANRRIMNHSKIDSVINRLQLFIVWCQEQADQALAWDSTWIAELERERNEKWMKEALLCKSMILRLIEAKEKDEVEEFRHRIFMQIAQENLLIEQWKSASRTAKIKEEKAIEIHQATLRILLRIATHSRYFEWSSQTTYTS